MRIGFIILCRFNSSRLPGKILKTIEGKTILQHIVTNLSTIIPLENIVVATSKESTDNPINDYCNHHNIQIYRGSLNNVSLRFLEASKQYHFDYATRINGDNLFIDVQTIQTMLTIAKTNQYDFISNVKNRTFPKGMSIEIVNTKYYEDQYQNFNDADDFEHVTIYLYKNDTDKKHYYFYNTAVPAAAGVQMAIDTQTDFNRAQKMLSLLKTKYNQLGLKEIFETYQTVLRNEQSI